MYLLRGAKQGPCRAHRSARTAFEALALRLDVPLDLGCSFAPLAPTSWGTELTISHLQSKLASCAASTTSFVLASWMTAAPSRQSLPASRRVCKAQAVEVGSLTCSVDTCTAGPTPGCAGALQVKPDVLAHEELSAPSGESLGFYWGLPKGQASLMLADSLLLAECLAGWQPSCQSVGRKPLGSGHPWPS